MAVGLRLRLDDGSGRPDEGLRLGPGLRAAPLRRRGRTAGRPLGLRVGAQQRIGHGGGRLQEPKRRAHRPVGGGDPRLGAATGRRRRGLWRLRAVRAEPLVRNRDRGRLVQRRVEDLLVLGQARPRLCNSRARAERRQPLGPDRRSDPPRRQSAEHPEPDRRHARFELGARRLLHEQERALDEHAQRHHQSRQRIQPDRLLRGHRDRESRADGGRRGSGRCDADRDGFRADCDPALHASSSSAWFPASAARR